MQATPRFVSFFAAASLVSLSACGGGGGGIGSILATPTPPPSNACGSAAPAPASYVSAPGKRTQSVGAAHPVFVPGVVEAVYDTTTGGAPAAASSLRNVAARDISDVTFEHVHRVARVISVAPGNEAAAMASLRSQPGVVAVSQPRFVHSTTSSAYFPNDPYLKRSGTAPYYQIPAYQGQWDMNAMQLPRAWGYGKGLGSINAPGALGGNSTIAVIDTGVDTSHPDLRAKFASYSAVYDTCNGAKNSAETMHDPDGHGTNVAGIAGASTDDGYGFAGAGFNALLMPFKVFPDAANSSATTTDISAAINDAVAHGVQVINISAGAAPTSSVCSNGGDDPVEAQAVANAVAAGVVVVASSGNESTGTLDCPGGDTGVIAVGASALNDTSNFEYVPSYSNYDKSNSLWGVVAPGGDPSSSSDADYLHWITNTWTSSAGSGYCTTDDFGAANDCREAIAGTSMSAPHVAGLVALMKSANSSLSPAIIKTILCQTADRINASASAQGCGRVNAYRAMARALGDNTVP